MKSLFSGFLFCFALAVGLHAQQFDNPVTIPITFWGHGVIGGPTGSFSFGAPLGATTSASGSGGGSGIDSPQVTAWVTPGKEYNVTVTSSGMAVVIMKFQPVSGCQVYFNGTNETSYAAGASYSVKVRIEKINDLTQSMGGQRGGQCSSFPEDKPIWYVGLGSLRTGRAAGAVGFRSSTLTTTPSIYSTGALVYDSIDPSEVTVTRDTGTGYITQIQSRDVVLNMTTISSTSYKIDACFPTTPTTPFITYTISQPTVSGGAGIRIDKLEDGENWATQLQLVGTTWTKYDWRKTAVGAAIDTSNAVTTAVSGSTSTVTYGSGAGSVTREKTYTTVNSHQELASSTLGPGTTSAPVTTYSYYSTSTGTGWSSAVQAVVEPTGGWTKYDYFNGATDTRAGQIYRIYRPFLDAPTTYGGATTSNCYLETYDYAASYDGSVTAPASKIVTINGTTAGKTTWDYNWSYSTVNTHSITQTVEKDYDTATTYLTTTTLAYRPDDATTFFQNKTHSVTHPNGTKESYAYYFGTYNTTTQVFTPSTSGKDRLILIFHGQTSASLGLGSGGVATSAWTVGTTSWTLDPIYLVPNVSTVTETVINTYGQLRFSAENIYTSSGTMERISAATKWCNANNLLTTEGDPIRTVTGTGGITVQVSHTHTAGLETKRTAADGSMTTWGYDNWLRPTTTTRAYGGTGSYPAVTQTTAYYSSGLVHTVADDAGTVVKTYTYDAAGRPTALDEAKPGGGTLTTTYDYPSLTQTTVTLPNGATKFTKIYLDGTVKEQGGTGQVDVQVIPNLESNGNLTRKTQNGGTVNNGWNKVTTDWLGRKVMERGPQVGYTPTANTLVIRKTYTYSSTTGQLESVSTTDEANSLARLLPDHLYDYGNLGLLVQEGDDLGNDGALDPASMDRITVSNSFFQKETGTTPGWLRYDQTKSYLSSNSGSTFPVLHERRTRYTSFNAGVVDPVYGCVVSDVVDVDASGRVTQTLDYVKPASRARYRTQSIGAVTNTAVSTWQDGYLASDVSASNVTKTYTYTGEGLLWTTTEGTTNAKMTNNYFADTAMLSSVVSTNGPTATVTTSYAYTWDSANHTATVATTDAASNVSYAMSNAHGLPWRTWGTGAQPTEIGYDAYDRRTSLTTWRSGTFTGSSWPASPPAGDVTTWTPDPATGAVTDKAYANSSTATVHFTYNARGQVKTRTWLRGTVTTYNYFDTAGSQTGELQGVTYSDSTPSVSYTYNRSGQLYTVADAAGTRTIHHGNDLLPTTEVYDASFYGSKTLTYTYDTTTGADGRATGFSFNGSSTVSATLGYDATTGRLASVKGALGATNRTFTLGYAGGTDWVNAVTYGSFARSTPLLAKRDVIGSVTTSWGSTTRGQFTASYGDARGWRDGQTSYSSSTIADGSWSWELGLGQGTGATYTHDAFGQLNGAPTPTWQGVAGTESLSARNFGWSYDLAGNRTAETGAAPTTYTPSGSDTTNKAYGSLNQYVTITGTLGEASLVYDADGNLTMDGTWNYTYDAENRLTSMRRIDLSQGLSFTYDYMGRRIRKVVTGTASSDTKFLWFGWRVVAELASNGTTVNRSFVWGPDFSDAQGGAGGAGALLAQIDGSSVSYAMPDVFGNIVGYLGSTGTLAAATEYSPYGRILKIYGSVTNYPIGYSGQYTDKETGLVYYGMRYYNPKHGRFINRDPSEEAGGNNLYGFVGNGPIGGWDTLGLDQEYDSGGKPVEPGYVQQVRTQYSSHFNFGYGGYGSSLTETNEVDYGMIFQEWQDMAQTRFHNDVRRAIQNSTNEGVDSNGNVYLRSSAEDAATIREGAQEFEARTGMLGLVGTGVARSDGSMSVTFRNGTTSHVVGATAITRTAGPNSVARGDGSVAGQSAPGAVIQDTPGVYKTRDEAAMAALKLANPASVRQNREYAGVIYKVDGGYTYTVPLAGVLSKANPYGIFVGDVSTVVGMYHTHGDYSLQNGQRATRATDYWNSDNFSQHDFRAANDALNSWSAGTFVSYLGTPSGAFQQMIPDGNRGGVVLPFIPHP